jgi:hypothetical protein
MTRSLVLVLGLNGASAARENQTICNGAVSVQDLLKKKKKQQQNRGIPPPPKKKTYPEKNGTARRISSASSILALTRSEIAVPSVQRQTSADVSRRAAARASPPLSPRATQSSTDTVSRCAGGRGAAEHRGHAARSRPNRSPDDAAGPPSALCNNERDYIIYTLI